MQYQSTYSLRRLTTRHNNRWLPLAGLLAFILVKGIVPAGFMPGSLASGSPYTLCHDDLRSVALLNLLAADQLHEPAPAPDDLHHHGHMGMAPVMSPAAGSQEAAHDYPDGNCDFSNSFAKALPTLSLDFTSEPAISEPFVFLAIRELSNSAWIRPLTRAPPLAAAV